MANGQIEFALEDCRLVSIHFEINNSFTPGKDVNLSITLNQTHEFIDTNNKLRTTVGVDLKGEDAPIKINAIIGGIFQFKDKPESESDLTRIAEVSCAAILFPFVREVVADITRRAGLPPLLLNPVNFVEIYNKNHPDTAINLN